MWLILDKKYLVTMSCGSAIKDQHQKERDIKKQLI